MSRIAAVLVAFATLSTGCAAMGTKRPEGGAQIQRTSAPEQTIDNGALDGRPELGQR